MQTRILPDHIVSLIHHMELTNSGWWEEAIRRCVLAQIYALDKPVLPNQIKKGIENDLGLQIRTQELQLVLSGLLENEEILGLNDGRYKLSEMSKQRLDTAVTQAKTLEEAAKSKFERIVMAIGNNLDAHHIWPLFIEKFLVPLVSVEGARIYELFVGVKKATSKWVEHFEPFLIQFPIGQRDYIRQIVYDFFSCEDHEVKRFLLSYLDGYFIVAASGLTPKTLEDVIETKSAGVEFVLFVDTNFVYSILGLHENPSNEAAKDLMDIASTLSNNVKIRFVIIPQILEEAEQSIQHNRRLLGSYPYPPNLARALQDTNISGVKRTYFERVATATTSVSTADYFEPYENNLAALLHEKGVELFSESGIDTFNASYEIDIDIESQKQYEKRYGDRAKSELSITRDIQHWHLVQNHREHSSAQSYSPIAAKYWIVTVDYRFLHFDREKTRRKGFRVPVCIHPTQLIQLLRFFVPVSPKFEDVLLGVMRMPVLMREFDPQAERISIRIAGNLARHENIEDINPSVLKEIITDETLRRRIEDVSSDEELTLAVNHSMARYLHLAEEHITHQNDKITSLADMVNGLVEESKATKKNTEKLTGDLARIQIEADEKAAAATRRTTELETIIATKDEELVDVRRQLDKTKTIIRWIISFLLFFIFLILITYSSQNMISLMNHPHRDGLITCLVSISICISLSITLPKYRKYILGTIVAGIFFVILQIM